MCVYVCVYVCVCVRVRVCVSVLTYNVSIQLVGDDHITHAMWVISRLTRLSLLSRLSRLTRLSRLSRLSRLTRLFTVICGTVSEVYINQFNKIYKPIYL